MSHNFQEVIDELKRALDSLTSNSGTYGQLNRLETLLDKIIEKLQTFPEEHALNARAALDSAIKNIQDAKRVTINEYQIANESLISKICGTSHPVSIYEDKSNTPTLTPVNARSRVHQIPGAQKSSCNEYSDPDKRMLSELLRDEAKWQKADQKRRKRAADEEKIGITEGNGSTYTSTNSAFPGDYPPYTPPNKNGIEYINRTKEYTEWVQYQEQISGWKVTDDGKIPEYVVPIPGKKPVEFDGHTMRGEPPVEIFLEAKHRQQPLLYYAEYFSSQASQVKFLNQVRRQLSVLPKNAELEWHISSKQGAQAISLLFIKAKIYSVKVVYTPFRKN